MLNLTQSEATGAIIITDLLTTIGAARSSGTVTTGNGARVVHFIPAIATTVTRNMEPISMEAGTIISHRGIIILASSKTVMDCQPPPA